MIPSGFSDLKDPTILHLCAGGWQVSQETLFRMRPDAKTAAFPANVRHLLRRGAVSGRPSTALPRRSGGIPVMQAVNGPRFGRKSGPDCRWARGQLPARHAQTDWVKPVPTTPTSSLHAICEGLVVRSSIRKRARTAGGQRQRSNALPLAGLLKGKTVRTSTRNGLRPLGEGLVL